MNLPLLLRIIFLVAIEDLLKKGGVGNIDVTHPPLFLHFL